MTNRTIIETIKIKNYDECRIKRGNRNTPYITAIVNHAVGIRNEKFGLFYGRADIYIGIVFGTEKNKRKARGISSPCPRKP